MDKFQNFYISDFSFDKASLIAKFNYSFDKELYFCEEIDFSCSGFDVKSDLNNSEIDTILSHIQIALGISYYKAYFTDNIIIENFSLSKENEDFWKKFYMNGLGEFMFVNKLSPKGKFNFKYESNSKLDKLDFETEKKALVPIGGGKDAILSIEGFKKAGIPFNTFTFGKDYEMHSRFSKTVAESRVIINRKISDELFGVNKSGAYNGHVPITGIIAFVSVMISYLYGYRYVSLSNEKSADFGNTEYEGINVNHQWSKSLDFEKSFSDYVNRNLSSNYKYFSLLRGLYEVKIVKEVSKYKDYYGYFTSCNNNFVLNKENRKTDKIWCLDCPKCAFVYSLFRPYLTNEEVIQIFGGDMYEDKSQENLFRELLGISGIKPFECVGTNEEVILSMYKALPLYDKLPYNLRIFKLEVASKMTKEDFVKLEEKLCRVYDEDNIPSEIKKLIKF